MRALVFCLAGEQGFEPQSSDPESDVLPIKLFPIDYDTVKSVAQTRYPGKFWPQKSET